MAFKTKIERLLLYKKDAEALEPYKERVQKSVKASMCYKLKWNDLQFLKSIHDKYYKGNLVDMNCNKCLMKMIHRVNELIKRYDKEQLK